MPCLLLKGRGLVKTRNFRNEVYVGDPINAVRIFNQMEVDELILLDIDATSKDRSIQFDLIEQVASECFMPICYGGGVRNIEDYARLFALGVEKVSVSSAFFYKPALISEAVRKFGSQSVVLTLDVKKHWFTKQYGTYTHSATNKVHESVVNSARRAEALGMGEIIINSVDRDGTWQGFDTELVRQVSEVVSVPVVALGGAGTLVHIKDVVKGAGASAVGLGSMAVFQGKGMGVLIKFPKMKDLEQLLDR